MNARHAFAPARAVARHADALLRPRPGATELLPALARAGERIAHLLPAALAPLLGGKAPSVVGGCPVHETTCAELVAAGAPLAANCLFSIGRDGTPAMLSIDAAAVFALVDRAFGGSGALPHPLPATFPMSADLMAARLERTVAATVAAEIDRHGTGGQVLRREADLRRLEPFAAETVLATLEFTVAAQDLAPWRIVVAVPQGCLPALFDPQGPANPYRATAPAPVDPADAPFCDLPLPLRAVVAEVDLPVATVSALGVGQVLPVSIARIVPLRVGSQTIAHGTVGAVDDRVAIQLTRTF